MPPRANIEPTERSNSPEIIRTVTPSASSPSSGMMPKSTRQLPALKNTGVLLKKMAPSTIITTRAVISGRDRTALAKPFM